MPRPSRRLPSAAALLGLVLLATPLPGTAAPPPADLADCIYDVGELPPRDSRPLLAPGDPAPPLRLPAVGGEIVELAAYRGRRNVVLSFVPAAWTPVCSLQWPQYHAALDLFEEHDAVLLGITVDNLPTLYAWTRQLSPDGTGLWFPVLSDFYPHGAVARRYGVLRSAGVAERALFVIDKQGIVRYAEVMDINRLPHLDRLARALAAVSGGG